MNAHSLNIMRLIPILGIGFLPYSTSAAPQDKQNLPPKNAAEAYTIIGAGGIQNWASNAPIKIVLMNSHASHPAPDGATALANIDDTLQGSHLAHRSAYYDTAMHLYGPGGTVQLNDLMLRGMLLLVQKHSFTVSEIAGGVHRGTAHYDGKAFDITNLDGQRLFIHNHNNKQNKANSSYVLGPDVTMKEIVDFENEARTQAGALAVYDPINDPTQEYGPCIHLQWEPPSTKRSRTKAKPIEVKIKSKT